MALSESAAQIIIKSILITIYLLFSKHFGVTAGVGWPAGGSADVKSFDIIEVSGSNNPKIDTNIDIYVVF